MTCDMRRNSDHILNDCLHSSPDHTAFQRNTFMHHMLGDKSCDTGRLILHIMQSFAEFECEMIKERTAAGKAIARQRPGYKEGRPKQITPETIEQIQKANRLGKTRDQQSCLV